MELLLLIIRLFLAAVFATAGAAKFADLAGAEKAATGFGIPERWAKLYAILLSALEIVIAAMLLFSATSFYGAIIAAQLLIIFIAGMAYQLYKGRSPECHCFGQLYSRPVSKLSVVRNVALLLLVMMLVARGRSRQGVDVWDLRMEMMPTLLAAFIAILVIGVILFLRKISAQQTEILRRIELLEVISSEGQTVKRDEAVDPNEGLPIGALFPDFGLPDVSGTTFSLDDLTVDGEPLLFLFVGPNCNPCGALVPEIAKWRTRLAGKAEIVLVSSGTARENRAKFGNEGLVLVERDRAIAKSVGARWTPTALFVSGDGRVASHLAVGDQAIRSLVDKIDARESDEGFVYFATLPDHGRPPKIGERIPDFRLADLNGREISSWDLIGRRTLITFWSPGCPHCAAMIDSIKEWERRRTADDPLLLLFSEGDTEQHRELGLRSPIVIDPGYKVAAALGMFGTPSAILVDERGVITTETAVGANNIWSLIQRSSGGGIGSNGQSN